jgi:hypothetical protein
MKKLGKLSIKPEKVIKNEELVNLRGGYGDGGICCCCSDGAGSCIGNYFDTGKTNLDDAFDVAYDECGNYNNKCNTSMECPDELV